VGQPARLPTRRELTKAALGIIIATAALRDSAKYVSTPDPMAPDSGNMIVCNLPPAHRARSG